MCSGYKRETVSDVPGRGTISCPPGTEPRAALLLPPRMLRCSFHQLMAYDFSASPTPSDIVLKSNATSSSRIPGPSSPKLSCPRKRKLMMDSTSARSRGRRPRDTEATTETRVRWRRCRCAEGRGAGATGASDGWEAIASLVELGCASRIASRSISTQYHARESVWVFDRDGSAYPNALVLRTRATYARHNWLVLSRPSIEFCGVVHLFLSDSRHELKTDSAPRRDT